MNHAAILRTLALAIGLVGIGALFPAAVALAQGEDTLAAAFGITVLAAGMFGGLLRVLVPKPDRLTRARDMLAVLALSWFIAPILALPAFYVGSDFPGLASALFEAVSCLTTTGTPYEAFSFYDARQISDPLLVWRGILHMLGAVATLAAALTVLPALNVGGAGMHRSRLFSGTSEGFMSLFVRAVQVSALALAVIFLLVALGLLATMGLSSRVFTIATSVVTTGLVDPFNDIGWEGGNPTSVYIVTLGLFLSAISLPTLLAIQAWPRRLLKDREAVILFTLIVLVGVIIANRSAVRLEQGLVWAASHSATSGVFTEPLSIGLESRLNFLAILLIFLGGSALSTVGGLKLARALLLAERSRVEFLRLGFPNSVVPFVYRGQRRDDSVILGVWVYLITYFVLALFLATLLSISNTTFEAAFRSSVAAFSNAGHMMDSPAGPLEALILSFSMILGRLDVLALLPLLVPSFWQD